MDETAERDARIEHRQRTELKKIKKMKRLGQIR